MILDWYFKYCGPVLRRHTFLICIALIFCCLIFLTIWTNPTAPKFGTLKIYDRNGELLYQQANNLIKSKEDVSLEKIPLLLQESVIVTEDESFYRNPGVDLVAMGRALLQDFQHRQIVSGASTITQQLVRFTVISPYTPAPQSILRKIREVLMAARLTLAAPKSQILNQYLNAMHFGYGVYGVQAASRLYFDKDVSQLSAAQSALLAGLIANPTQFDPVQHPYVARKRRDTILQKLHDRKFLNDEEYQRAVSEALPTQLTSPTSVAPHVIQMIIAELQQRHFLSANSAHLATNQDLSVTTTIDANWYRLSLEIAQRQIEKVKAEHHAGNAAVIVIENQTGRILSLVGSVNYFDQSIQGQNNMATTLRQPGSALKPVTYAVALNQKVITPATVILDEPKVYITQQGESFTPHNYDGRYRGPVSAREALASSYNMPAVEVLSRIGLPSFLDAVHQLGVTSMQDVHRYDLALTLGGGEIDLLEMSNIYATFARDGQWVPYHLIEKVAGQNGQILYQNQTPTPKKVFSPNVAWLITNILSDPLARVPTFGYRSPLVVDKPAAVKTGTTTDWHDNWTVGYTPQYTVGVWVGNADNSPMTEITGVTGAAPIWHDLMNELMKYAPTGDSVSAVFPEPPGIEHAEICSWDGLLPNTVCTQRKQEVFLQGTVPTEVTNLQSPPAADNQVLNGGNGGLQILSPKTGANYVVSGLSQEKVTFSVTADPSIQKITWILDGKSLSANDCRPISPFSCVWSPIVRSKSYQLEAIVMRKQSTDQRLGPSFFLVSQYKEGW